LDKTKELVQPDDETEKPAKAPPAAPQEL